MDPGIAPDALEHIFDRFYRGDPAREGSGTGLGLALVRSIVQLHQGKSACPVSPAKEVVSA